MLDLFPNIAPKVQSEKLSDSIEYKRKPYRKNPKAVLIPPPLQIPENPSPNSFKLPVIPDLHFPQTTTRRTLLDIKILSLIELGLNPSIPLGSNALRNFKKDKKNSIKISDFMKKSHQHRILSHQNLPYSSSSDKIEIPNFKDRIPPAFSFSGKSKNESRSVRNSASFQALPPLASSDSKLTEKPSQKLKREENLKKIDRIVDSCKELLEKKKSKKKNEGKNQKGENRKISL